MRSTPRPTTSIADARAAAPGLPARRSRRRKAHRPSSFRHAPDEQARRHRQLRPRTTWARRTRASAERSYAHVPRRLPQPHADDLRRRQRRHAARVRRDRRARRSSPTSRARRSRTSHKLTSHDLHAPLLRRRLAGSRRCRRRHGDWRTVLVGGLGAGGQGLYALDVTDPAAVQRRRTPPARCCGNSTTPTTPISATCYGKPVIRKMANGRWAAIVSGGYNNSEGDAAASATGHARTSSSSSSTARPDANRTLGRRAPTTSRSTPARAMRSARRTGSRRPSPRTSNGDGMVDFVYAGDLRGNLWKFDVRSTHARGLDGARATGSSLFTRAGRAAATAQPITAQAGRHAAPDGQGIHDRRSAPASTSSRADPQAPYHGPELLRHLGQERRRDDVSAQTTGRPAAASCSQQTITDVTVGTTRSAWSRTTCPTGRRTRRRPAANDSPSKHMGWYMDFPSSTTHRRAQRVPADPPARRLIFTTLVPSDAACDFGGTSFLMVRRSRDRRAHRRRGARHRRQRRAQRDRQGRLAAASTST